MSHTENRQKKSAPRQSKEWYMVVAFSLVIVAMMTILLVVLSHRVKLLSDTSYNLVQNQATSISGRMTNLFDNYRKMGTILSVNPRLVDYAGYSVKELESDYYRRQAYDLSTDMLQLLNLYGESINTLAAYFPASDSVVTMSRQLDTTNTHLFFDSHPNLTPTALDQLFNHQTSRYALVTEADKNWIVQKVTTITGDVAYLMFQYNLSAAVGQMTANTDGILVLAGSGSNLLFANIEIPVSQLFDQLLQDAADGTLSWGGGYITCCEETDIANISVVVGVTSQEITSIRRHLALLAMSTAIITIGSLALLLYHLRGRVFRPIEQLVTSRCKENLDTRKALSSISQDLRSIEDNRDQLLRERNFLAPVTIGRLIYRIVCAPEDRQNINRAISCLSIAGINQNQTFAAFSLALVEDTENFFTSQTLVGSGFSRLHFFLDNVLRDSLFNRYPGYVIPVGTTHYEILVVCPPDAQEEVYTACKNLCSFYEEHFAVLFCATAVEMGQCPKDFVNIAIRQAKEVYFRSFWGESAEGEPTEEMGSGTFYACCNSIRQLVASLNTDNFDKIWQSMDALLAKALPIDEDSVKNTRYRMYAITAFLITAIEESLNGKRKMLESGGLDARLYDADNINDYRKEVKAILWEVADSKAAQERDVFVSGRMEDIRHYLQEHYNENTISVTAVAEEFGISTSYLSRSFKEAFGVNLLEYIQRLRITQAKKLLRTQTVQSVAKEVGFWNTQALTRAFKKYEGIAPTDYKRFLEKEQNWT